MYCIYYQAKIDRKKTWLVVGALRSCEGMTFERTLQKDLNLFEFFTSPDMEASFIKLMNFFIEQGIVTEMTKRPNRFINHF